MTTNAYAAKRAIVARLAALAAPGGRLSTVVISYAYPGDLKAGRQCVYGGGVRFSQVDDAVDGSDVLAQEAAIVSLYIRIVRDVAADDVELADVDAESIGEVIGEELARDPKLAGGLSYASLTSGQGDYSITDDQVVSLLTYLVTVTSYIKP